MRVLPHSKPFAGSLSCGAQVIRELQNRLCHERLSLLNPQRCFWGVATQRRVTGQPLRA